LASGKIKGKRGVCLCGPAAAKGLVPNVPRVPLQGEPAMMGTNGFGGSPASDNFFDSGQSAKVMQLLIASAACRFFLCLFY